VLRLSEQIAREFAEKVRAKAPGQTREIYLYGSRARGDEEPDSDYDVLIVVEQKTPELEDQIMEAAVEVLDDHDVFVSPFICTADNFERYREVGMYREVLREGVQL
jgi:predicted nucleotidyltransferase